MTPFSRIFCEVRIYITECILQELAKKTEGEEEEDDEEDVEEGGEEPEYDEIEQEEVGITFRFKAVRI